MFSYARHIVIAGLLLISAVFITSVWQKEQLLKNGERILVRLAPVDPRSLMQGDYMRLNYALQDELERQARQQLSGKLVYFLDENSVARFVRLHSSQTSLSDKEQLLKYRIRNSRLQLGSPSFFFQEGRAEHFENAAYGELRVTRDGEALLVGLVDEDYRLLGLSSGL